MNRFSIFLFIILLGCSNNNAEPASKIPEKIEHTYFSIGDTVPDWSFNYIVNSVKEELDLSAKEGNKWILLDVSYEDTAGKEDEYQEFSSIYGDFVLLDEKGYIYKAYERDQITQFDGKTRDYVLFMVPYSQKQFKLFSDFLWDDTDSFDDESRNVVIINL